MFDVALFLNKVEICHLKTIQVSAADLYYHSVHMPTDSQHCQLVPSPVDKLPIEKNRRGISVMSAHPHLTV